MSEPHFPSAIPPRTPAKPYSLHIPPAHSISYVAVPNGIAPSPISEEDTGPGSSVEDEDDGPLEVHENERFARRASLSRTSLNNRHVRFPAAPSSAESYRIDRSPTKRKDGERHRNPSLFGSIAAFLRKGGSNGTPSDDGISSSSRRWHTRLDKNIKRAGRDNDSSEDEAAVNYARHASTLSASYVRTTSSAMPVSPLTPSPSTGSPLVGPANQRRKTLKRSSVPVPAPGATSEKGWMSDGVAASGSKKGKAKSNAGANGSASSPSSAITSTPKKRAVSVDTNDIALHAVADVKASLSRNSSLSKQSVMSAPAHVPVASTSRLPESISTGQHESLSRRKRNTVSGSSPKSASTPGSPGHRRTASLSGPPMSRSGLTRANDEPSLMSIVENVSRQNKEAWIKQDPNRMLISVKAPPPVNVSLELENSPAPALPTSTSMSVTPANVTPRVAEKRPAATLKDSSVNRSSLTASASAPSLPISTPSRPAAATATKSPLRSALRNHSRSPSPQQPQNSAGPSLDPVAENGKHAVEPQHTPTPMVPSPSVNTVSTTDFYSPAITSSSANTVAPTSSPATFYSPDNTPSPANTSVNISSPATFYTPVIPSSPAIISSPANMTVEPSRRRSLIDDNSSISSYETTREVFDDEAATETEVPPLPPPPPPPSNEKPKLHLEGSDVSRNTDSTTSAALPARRKSVRMSLPPTFSTTPPALDDDDESQRDSHRPWADVTPRSKTPNGWGSKIEENGVRDAWADSSDEDEDYSRARRLLSRLSRKAVH